MRRNAEVLRIAVPVIQTARLCLRGHRLSDYSNCIKLWGDQRVTQYIGGRPLSEEEAWMRLLRYVGHWALMGFGYWLFEDKQTGEFLGEGGFQENQRDLEPSLKGMMETGWVLMPHAHGKGYATEAVRAMHAWKDANFPDKRVCCIVDVPNAASLRVAEKSGYRETARTTYHGDSIVVLVREERVNSTG